MRERSAEFVAAAIDQLRTAGADAGDALAVSLGRRAGEQGGDVRLMIGGDALQPADRDGLVLDSAATAGGLAASHVRVQVQAAGVHEMADFYEGAAPAYHLQALAEGQEAEPHAGVGVMREAPRCIAPPPWLTS